MRVHLVDGTYELFRHHFALPSHLDARGREVAALRGVVRSIAGMLADGATHLGVATDHVVESFRNQMWPGYKSGEGMDPELLAQFHPLEEALTALGVSVWPMIEFEADDGLAPAAALARPDSRIEKIFLCTPDKDLAQCVVGTRIVLLDRRKRAITNEKGVLERFGVYPDSIPDYLALVGDSADGFPGLPGWGARSTATVLARYRHLEAIPDAVEAWEVKPRGAARLAAALAAGRVDAGLFKKLATLRLDAPVGPSPESWRWQGPTPEFAGVCKRIGAPELIERVEGFAQARGRG